jgi:hypothetical protein
MSVGDGLAIASWLAGALLAVAAVACGSDVETRDGSGGSGGSSSSTGAPSATSGSGDGGADCQPWEPCTCAPCVGGHDDP